MAKRTFFPHLHAHSDNSVRDGVTSIDAYAELVAKLGGGSLALTEHGSASGYATQYFACKKHGIKPIYGMECYIQPNRHSTIREEIKDLKAKLKAKKNKDAIIREQIQEKTNWLKMNFRPSRHGVVLAKNRAGYSNIVRMSSDSWKNGYYYFPRTDFDFMKDHAEGVIYSTACIGGHIPVIARQNFDEGVAEARRVRNIFRDGFYVELMITEYSQQRQTNIVMMDLAKKLGCPMIITCDVHYAKKSYGMAQDIMLLMRDKKTIKDRDAGEGGWQFEAKDLYWRSLEDVVECWKKHHSDYIPKDVFKQAIKNTYALADSIEQWDFDTSLKLPGIFSESEYTLKERVKAGIRWRHQRGDLSLSGRPIRDYIERARMELDIVTKKGFAEYFLIVNDITDHARSVGATIGPGRGSACGSIISYALRITDVDPLRFGLLFERFLAVDRSDPPDIDLDFTPEHRDQIKAYIQERYPTTASIGTFSTFKPRAILRDVGRVFGIDHKETMAVTKGLGTEADDKTWDEIFDEWPAVKKWAQDHPDAFGVVKALKGLISHRGKNAAGVLIAPESAADDLPMIIERDKDGNETVVTAFPDAQENRVTGAGRELSRLGYLKMDILGVQGLSIAPRAVELVSREKGIDIDIEKIPLDDEAALDKATRADVPGIFQFDSETSRPIMKMVGVDDFMDLVMITALARPGPLKHNVHKEFANRKKTGDSWKEGLADDLVPLLAASRGLMILQEDVMHVVQVLGGLSFAEANVVRKVMAKKLDDSKFEPWRIKFIEGGIAKGYDEEMLKDTFNHIKTFSSYGFNKSVRFDTKISVRRGIVGISDGDIDGARDAKKESVELSVWSDTPIKVETDRASQNMSDKEEKRTETASDDMFMWREVSKQDCVEITQGFMFGKNTNESRTGKKKSAEVANAGSNCEKDSDIEIQDLCNDREEEKIKSSKCSEVLDSLGEECRRETCFFGECEKNFCSSRDSGTEGKGTKRLEECKSRETSNGNKRCSLGAAWCWGNGDIQSPIEEAGCRAAVSNEDCEIKNHIFRLSDPINEYSDRDRWGGSLRETGRCEEGSLDREMDKETGSLGTNTIGNLQRQVNEVECSDAGPSNCREAQAWGSCTYRGQLYEEVEEEIEIKEVIPGRDRVRAIDGTWVDVVALHDHGIVDCHEAKFQCKSGHSFVVFCTAEHRFPTQMGNVKLKDMTDEHLIPTVYDDARLVSVKPSGKAHVFDLEIDHPSHCYYLANGIATHNSHSVAYSLTAYRQLYMLAHYPVEYMTALLAYTDNDKEDVRGGKRLPRFIRSAWQMGIDVLPPCIFDSSREFDVRDGKIRFGLAKIKGVANAADAIIAARPFSSLEEFIEKVDTRKVNARVIDALINSGALDSLPFDRSAIEFEEINDLDVRNAIRLAYRTIRKSKKEFTRNTPTQMLALENDVLGITLSWWNSDKKERLREAYGLVTIKEAKKRKLRRFDVVAEVSSVRTHTSKRGEMAFLVLSDETGSLDNFVVWSGEWKEFKRYLSKGKFVVVSLERKENKNKRYGRWSYYLRKVKSGKPVRSDVAAIRDIG